MPELDPNREYCCNVCSEEVAISTHIEHVRILFKLTPEQVENLFVHQRGGPSNFDDDGMVIVCDRHFIQELAVEMPMVEE